MGKLNGSSLIKFAVSAGILLYLGFMIDWSLFWRSLKQASMKYFILALLVMPVAAAFRFYRFKLIINERVPGNKRITMWDSVKIYCVGYALNLVMPASTGDIARSYYAYRQYGIREEMLSASILDLVFGLVAMFILALYYALKLGFGVYALLSLIAIAAGSVFIFFPKAVPWVLVEKIAGLARLKMDKKALLNGTLISTRLKVCALFISVLSWYFTIVQFYFIVRMYSIDVPFSFAAGIFPVLLVSRLIPIAINGLGTQEAASTYLFSLAGIDAAHAVLVSFTLTFTFIMIPGFFGIYWLATMKRKDRKGAFRDNS